MKKLIAYLLVFGLVLTGFSMTTSAFGGHHHGGGFNQNRRDEDYNRNPLDLTEEQLDVMDDVRDDFFDEREELGEEMMEANFELRELIINDGSSEKIAELKEEVNRLQTKMNNLRFSFWQEMKEVLSEEQIEEMQDFEEEYNGHRFMGFGMGFGMNDSYGPHGPGMMYNQGHGYKGHNNFNGGWCH